MSSYELRDQLHFARDGRDRAVAARRLGAHSNPAMRAPLLEAAVSDPLPSVREAAWRSLSRRADFDERTHAAARLHCTRERVWWVRMAIASFLANGGGDEQVAALRDVLLDPFWRVRHVAIKALQRLGEREADKQAAITAAPARSDVEGAALLFLERAWLGAGGPRLEPQELPSPPPDDPLWDLDPAVISARLEEPDAEPTLGLLAVLLADAHASTRRLAFEHLRRRADLRETRVILEWLDEPRIPYASELASRLANALGDRSRLLAKGIFAEEAPGAGPLCWALSWTEATIASEFTAAATRALDHDDDRVREAAIGCVYKLGAARAHSERLREIAANGESSGERMAACRVLISVSPQLAAGLLDQAVAPPAPMRRLLAQVASRNERWSWLEAAERDRDPRVRASAISALAKAGRLDDETRAAALADADPWIRIAALDDDSAAELAITDAEAPVRLAAIQRATDSATWQAAAVRSASDRDPGVRAGAARVLGTARASLAALLHLTRDAVLAVRSVAGDRLAALDRKSSIDPAVANVLATASDESTQVAALTWLCRHFDDSAARVIESAVDDQRLAGAARRHAQVIRLGLPAAVACSVRPIEVSAAPPKPARAPTAPPTLATLRPLGKTGIEVSPLAISGAKELAVRSYHAAYHAGINLYFWEPRYHRLGAFLRQPDIASNTHVVAGSYHATPDAIEKDVATALRRLRRDSIDLFLIFWVRSAERLSPDVIECLHRLRDRGLIRACGFSSHHRDIAADAIRTGAWDAMMVRHSAAHTGAEEELLPLAEELGVGVLGFTSLCYGRLLARTEARAKTRAPDCYRYTLDQPAMSAVISAPGQHHELVENLAVARDPRLAPTQLMSMREHGAIIYEQSKDFGALIRRTPRAVPSAAVMQFHETPRPQES